MALKCNKNFIRYTIKDDEFYNAVKFAIRGDGSLVIQSGENTNSADEKLQNT